MYSEFDALGHKFAKTPSLPRTRSFLLLKTNRGGARALLMFGCSQRQKSMLYPYPAHCSYILQQLDHLVNYKFKQALGGRILLMMECSWKPLLAVNLLSRLQLTPLRKLYVGDYIKKKFFSHCGIFPLNQAKRIFPVSLREQKVNRSRRKSQPIKKKKTQTIKSKHGK